MCLVSLVIPRTIIGLVLHASIDPTEEEEGIHRAELLSSHIRRKMAAGLLLLVCAGAVLCSAKAQDPYDELPLNYRKGVDLAFDQLNSHARVVHHFRFMKSVEKSEMEVNVKSEFITFFFHGKRRDDLAHCTKMFS